MTFDLFLKEFKFNRQNRKTSSFVLSCIFGVSAIALIVVLIVYMTLAIDDKIVEYAPDNVTQFVSLFLFIFFVIMVIEGLMRARRVTYNETDARILSTISISKEEIVTSKMLYVFVYQLGEAFLLCYPLLAAYGFNRGEFVQFYLLSAIYPLYISVISTGLVFVLLSLYQLCYIALKGHDIVQFVLASVIVIGLCFVYQFFLDLFLTALNDSSIGAVFSSDFIEGLSSACSFFYPVSFYLEAWFDSYNMLSNFLFLAIGIILLPWLGRLITSLTYNWMVKRSSNSRPVSFAGNRMTTPFRALVRKEINILFRNSGETFSYTALLIMMPFLSYVVISSLNNIIFDNLAVFAAYFPDLIDGLTLTLVLLFVTCINASGSQGMSREGKSLQTVKFLPVKPRQVIMSKLLVPISLSSLSTLVTMIILYATGTCDLNVFWSGTLIGIMFVFVCNIVGLYVDMLDQGGRNLSFVNTLVSLLLPVLILGVTVALNFTSLNSLAVFTVDVFIAVAFLAASILVVVFTYDKVFKKMEARQR